MAGHAVLDGEQGQLVRFEAVPDVPDVLVHLVQRRGLPLLQHLGGVAHLLRLQVTRLAVTLCVHRS